MPSLACATKDILDSDERWCVYGDSGQDRFSSRTYEAPHRQKILSHPRTWLLRSGWRRARRVPQWLAAKSWPPPWTQEHRPDAPARRIDCGAG